MTKVPEYKKNIIKYLVINVNNRTCKDCLEDLADYYIALVKLAKGCNRDKNDSLKYVEWLIKEFNKKENIKELYLKVVIDSL